MGPKTCSKICPKTVYVVKVQNNGTPTAPVWQATSIPLRCRPKRNLQWSFPWDEGTWTLHNEKQGIWAQEMWTHGLTIHTNYTVNKELELEGGFKYD